MCLLSNMCSAHNTNYRSLHKITNLAKELSIKDDNVEGSEEPEPVFRFANSEFFDDSIECVYKPGDSFENLSKVMFDIFEDKIKKRVLQRGKGPLISKDSTVTFDYEAYIEHNDKPFDFTSKYCPHTILLGEDHPLPGFKIAIQSMQTNELSQFLMNSNVAYGKVDWLNVSPDVLALFVIRIKKVVNVNHNNESFRDVFIKANVCCTKGNEFFSKGLIRKAVKEYKDATQQLEIIKISNNVDLEKQRQLLLRLYTNLVVAFTKVQETRSACIYSKMIYKMCRGTNLSVPIKVYINHARSLVLVPNLREAEKLLREAERLDPNNQEIAKEIFKLKMLLKSGSSINIPPIKSICLKGNKPVEISKEFKDAMAQYCLDLLSDMDTTQYELPTVLTQAEQTFVLTEVRQHGLYFKQIENNGITKFFISKNTTFG